MYASAREPTKTSKTRKTKFRGPAFYGELMPGFKPKPHYFDLLQICCTRNPQQIEVMEFGLYELGLNLGMGARKTPEWKTQHQI